MPEEILNPVIADIILSDEQKAQILEMWNSGGNHGPPPIRDIAFKIFNKKTSAYSPENIAIKIFLSEKKPKPSKVESLANIIEEKVVEIEQLPAKSVFKIELTDDQKEFIENNCKELKPVELTKAAFKKENIGPTSRETVAVISFLKSLHREDLYENPERLATESYRPPMSPEKTTSIVNKYIRQGLKAKSLTSRQKKEIGALTNYLHSLRFINQINSYETVAEREFFESEFVRCTWDKSDLTEEEVDQYITYASEVIISTVLDKRIRRLGQTADDLMSGEIENQRIGMSMVEAIKDLRANYNSSIIRQGKLLDTLKGKRSERIEKMEKGGASILNLVELWRHQDTRERIIKVAEKRKDVLKEGYDKLSEMDDLKVKILGVDFNLVSNG